MENKTWKCDICQADVEETSGNSVVINHCRNYFLCPDCMWHFREMWGKLLEERRSNNE